MPPEDQKPTHAAAETSGDKSGAVVTRFAPSPTGELHIGGARTALYAWAFARRSGGTFQLRFEDTDLARSSEASAQRILDDLQWLGLVPDNYDPAKGIDSIPRQSQRLDRYHEIVQQLLDAGEAYADGDAVRFRMGAHRGDVTFDDAVYGTVHTPAADLEDFIIRKGAAGGRMPTFHLAVVVDDHDFGCTHVIRGQEHLSNTPKHAALCDALGWDRPVWAHTPSIMNPGGSKMSKRDKAKAAREAYLKIIENKEIDDDPFTNEFMKILSEWDYDTSPLLAPNPKRTLREFYETIVWSREKSDQDKFQAMAETGEGYNRTITEAEFQQLFADFVKKNSHDINLAIALSFVLQVDLPEIEVSDFRNAGYLPAALLNYVALLGWNPGHDLEKFDLDFMAEHFDLKRINKANSTFDRAKLASFNQDAILGMPPEIWETTLREQFEEFHTGFIDKLCDDFGVFAAAYHERSKTLTDPATLGRFFAEAPTEYDDKAVKKNLTKNDGEGLKTLAVLREALPGVEPWSAPTIRAALDAAWQELGGKNMGTVAQPLRVALTGTAVSPEIDATLALLGKDETLKRIDACLTHVPAATT